MRVKFFAYLRDYAGCSETNMPAAATIGELARVLSDRYGPRLGDKLLTPDGDLGTDLIVMVNGRHINHLGGINAALKDEDTVQIFPMVAGG